MAAHWNVYALQLHGTHVHIAFLCKPHGKRIREIRVSVHRRLRADKGLGHNNQDLYSREI